MVERARVANALRYRARGTAAIVICLVLVVVGGLVAGGNSQVEPHSVLRGALLGLSYPLCALARALFLRVEIDAAEVRVISWFRNRRVPARDVVDIRAERYWGMINQGDPLNIEFIFWMPVLVLADEREVRIRALIGLRARTEARVALMRAATGLAEKSASVGRHARRA